MEALKKYLYQRKISQGKAKHQPSDEVNVQKASKIGIIFDATQLAIRQPVINFKKYLMDKGFRVKLLGYINEKIESISFPFDYFSLKDVNFHYVPEGDNVRLFLSEQFDILMNLDLEDALPLHYIAAVANAGLKVGAPSPEHAHYDLMIETGHERSVDAFIKEIRKTLNKIQ